MKEFLEKPLVSVILPCFNCEDYIELSINSILMQTYMNIELLVVDDCSTDNSAKIIETLAQKDNRITVIQHAKNQGIVRTLNELIGFAKGKYVARMDADDISLPKRIEMQVEFLEKNPEIVACGTNYTFINEYNSKLKESDLPCSSIENRVFLKYYSTICHPSVMVRAEIYRQHKYKEDFIYAEDYELWCRLVFGNGLQVANLPDILFLYRVSENQICNKNHRKQFVNTARIYEENNVMNPDVLEVHKELLYLMENEEFTKQVDEYIGQILREIKEYDYKYSYLVVDRIFYYLRKHKKYVKACKMIISPIGFDMIIKKLRWLYNSRIKRG